MTIALKREDVLLMVRSQQAALEAMGVKSLRLFGSVARDRANPDSDVDFLVEFVNPIGFFQLFQVKYYLENLLDCPVDLGTAEALREHLRKPVMKETIRVF